MTRPPYLFADLSKAKAYVDELEAVNARLLSALDEVSRVSLYTIANANDAIDLTVRMGGIARAAIKAAKETIDG